MGGCAAAVLCAAVSLIAGATEYHVAVTGDDAADGSAARPFRTISAAAERAQPGDVITVHEGVYRERIAPPRGGTSDAERIVYQAADGEDVVIKGSEPAEGWVADRDDVWTLTLPSSFFGDFNPFADEIRGDWFDPLGRTHHTGAVYLDGHWLTEAAERAHVYSPDEHAALYAPGGNQFLLNVAWFGPAGSEAARMPASAFSDQRGLQTAPCSEGGDCVGWINHGDWAVYDGVSLPRGGADLEIRAASVTTGGTIEVRADRPDGPLLGSCFVPNTGGWQSWESFIVPIVADEPVEALCLAFRSGEPHAPADVQLWFAEVNDAETTIWARFPGINPNEADVEINVRQTVFYPAEPGIDYLTVRGFKLRHAATNWAPPTAEQVGLIGTHWSKGWIIENNDIAYATCVGVTLGKHGDEFDNTSANTAEGYVKTIERAHAFRIPWTKDRIGGHIVRNNRIAHCEQAGLVGSLGAAFSTISHNEIHEIHMRRLFTGAEMAGIKIHAAIDTEISNNRIYRCCQGLWLDWMAQGTRVTANVFFDNPDRDLFMEVNHGPYMVDNNVFLSPNFLLDMSEGGAFVHNLIAGAIAQGPEPNRETPYHKPHSTEVVGLIDTKGGDNRFYNNVFAGGNGLAAYDAAERPMYAAGNVYLKDAAPGALEENALVYSGVDLDLRPAKDLPDAPLRLGSDPDLRRAQTQLVTTDLLGASAVTGLPYVNVDGAPLRFDADMTGAPRDPSRPTPGPLETVQGDE